MFENRLVPWQRRRPMPATMPRVFGGLQEEINRLFDDFWGEAATPLSGVRSSIVSPRVDLSESEDAYQISAEMPGLKEDEIEVNFSDGVLSIKGEHKAESERKDALYHVRERSYGSFQRSFRLPESADVEKIGARFEDGVLSIAVPKRAEAKAQARRIAIEKA